MVAAVPKPYNSTPHSSIQGSYGHGGSRVVMASELVWRGHPWSRVVACALGGGNGT